MISVGGEKNPQQNPRENPRPKTVGRGFYFVERGFFFVERGFVVVQRGFFSAQRGFVSAQRGLFFVRRGFFSSTGSALARRGFVAKGDFFSKQSLAVCVLVFFIESRWRVATNVRPRDFAKLLYVCGLWAWHVQKLDTFNIMLMEM